MGKRNNLQFILCVLGIGLLLTMCNSRNQGNSTCNDKSKTRIDTVYQFVQVRDSIIYELPPKTTHIIIKMIKDKKVNSCGLVSNTDNNEYSFSFPYTDKTLLSKKDSILVKKTNRYLKINDRYLPLVSLEDSFFSNIPENQGIINDFNFCYVAVDARGNVSNSFAY